MHFRPTVIDTAVSRYSGLIKVVDGFGFRHLSTDSIQHSGGIVREIWQTALKSSAQKNRTWLVLGIAGGSVLHLISQKYPPKKIIGIDIDPVIVSLGRKYFDLNKIPHLDLKITDAGKYIQKHTGRFDYILVDLFGSNSCPDFVYQPRFLRQLKTLGSEIFINHLYNSPASKNSYTTLQKTLHRLKITSRSQFIRQNVVIKI